MEYLLENKLTCCFKVRNVYPKDIGYILEYLHGQSGIPYEEYDYPLPRKNTTLIIRYDLLKPTRYLIEQKQR